MRKSERAALGYCSHAFVNICLACWEVCYNMNLGENQTKILHTVLKGTSIFNVVNDAAESF